MTEKEMDAKYKRLNDRLIELNALEANIGKLAFYLNENNIEDENCKRTLREQLASMYRYRDALQDRITDGYY